jgi:exodeoxyribonuclease-1
MRLLETHDPQALVHTSSRYPAIRGCTSLVLPLCVVPDRPKSVVVFDLMANPAVLLEADAGAIADRVFTPNADLPEDVERIPLKAVHSNKVPMLAPPGVLQETDTARIGLDVERCIRHAELLRPRLRELRPKLMDVFAPPPPRSDDDPDLMLYGGGFFSPADKALMKRITGSQPEALGASEWPFKDARLPEMLFRYRARNWPETLDAKEVIRWDQDRRHRLLSPDASGAWNLSAFQQELAQARSEKADDGRAQRILDALEAWVLETGLHDA